jgi:hypothetical protein
VLGQSLVLALSLAASPSPFAAEEKMQYAIDYLGMSVGRAQIEVGRPEGPIVPVILQARTSGLGAVLDFRQQIASYVDLATGLPRSCSLFSVEPGYRLRTDTRYDRRSGKATVREQGKYDNTYEVDFPEGTLDFVALVFRLRALPLEAGAHIRFDVLAGTKVSPVVAEVAGRETLETGAGKFQTVKIRVPTGLTGKFSEKSPTFVWLSDDARRIVVRITTNFAIGRADANLVSYAPGKPAG